MARVRERLDRYFEAFEARTMKPEHCGVKIENLNGLLAELEARRQELSVQAEQLALPALEKSTVAALLETSRRSSSRAPTLRKGTSSTAW